MVSKQKNVVTFLPDIQYASKCMYYLIQVRCNNIIFSRIDLSSTVPARKKDCPTKIFQDDVNTKSMLMSMRWGYDYEQLRSILNYNT